MLPLFLQLDSLQEVVVGLLLKPLYSKAFETFSQSTKWQQHAPLRPRRSIIPKVSLPLLGTLAISGPGVADRTGSLLSFFFLAFIGAFKLLLKMLLVDNILHEVVPLLDHSFSKLIFSLAHNFKDGNWFSSTGSSTASCSISPFSGPQLLQFRRS